jgi:hypothetical protein
MPTPPSVSVDYNVFIVGGPQSFSLQKLWTWGQVRTPVYAGGHGAGGSYWSNYTHHYDYFHTSTNGIDAVESQDRLFRGQPYGAIGYDDWQVSTSTPPYYDKYFFFGSFYESPYGSGNYVPGVGSGLDIEEQATILGGATFVGSGTTITTSAASYDGSDPNGQNIGSTALGTVSSVTLAF